jgi:hypothetical protein
MAEPDFAWRELDVHGGSWMRSDDEDAPLRPDTFRLFQVQVKSDADIGREMLHDPISVLRHRTDIDIPDDVRAMVLRVNAEVPANPKHRSYVFAAYPGSMTLIGLQFKYDQSEYSD